MPGQRAGGVLGQGAADGSKTRSAPPVGRLTQERAPMAPGVVDRCVGAELAAERRSLLVAHHGNHLGAERVS